MWGRNVREDGCGSDYYATQPMPYSDYDIGINQLSQLEYTIALLQRYRESWYFDWWQRRHSGHLGNAPDASLPLYTHNAYIGPLQIPMLTTGKDEIGGFYASNVWDLSRM